MKNVSPKGSVKNNFTFSRSSLPPSSAAPQSRNPQRRPGYACGFAQSFATKSEHELCELILDRTLRFLLLALFLQLQESLVDLGRRSLEAEITILLHDERPYLDCFLFLGQLHFWHREDLAAEDDEGIDPASCMPVSVTRKDPARLVKIVKNPVRIKVSGEECACSILQGLRAL